MILVVNLKKTDYWKCNAFFVVCLCAIGMDIGVASFVDMVACLIMKIPQETLASCGINNTGLFLFHEFERLAVYVGNIYALVQCGNRQLRYIVAVQQHLSCHVVNADACRLSADNAFGCGTIICL